MKRCVVIAANDSTYTYNLRRELIQGLINAGYRVCVVCEELNHADKIMELGCVFYPVKTGRHGTDPLADLALLKTYSGILKKEKPFAVLTYNIKPNVYCGIACRLLKIPYFPNVTGLGTVLENGGLMQKLTSALYRTGISGAKNVFFQNASNLGYFRDHGLLPAKKEAVVLPGSGVSLTEHPFFDYPAKEAPEFLFVGRVMRDKGVAELLAAMEKLHKENASAILHICGYCDDDGFLSVLDGLKDSEYIRYHGEQKDILPFYEKCSCVVLPSYHEGMSNVLLEAGAHGRPVITSGCPGCADAVDGEKNGYLVPVRDEEALYEAMKKFALLPVSERAEMGARGRAFVAEKFDRSIVVDKYLGELERLNG